MKKMKIGDLVTIREEVMGCRPRVYFNNNMGIIIALQGDVCSVSFIGTDEIKSFYVQDVEVIK